MNSKNNLTRNKDRLDYLSAQQRLIERHSEANNPLSLEDIQDLETILKKELSKVNYSLKELEKIRLARDGRIYGRANVLSTGENDENLTRHHAAVIDFHTTHAYSIVFDNHKIGGDEWTGQTNKTIYTLSYDSAKQRMYLNDVEIYKTKAGNADIVLRTAFEREGTVKECSEFTDAYGHNRKDTEYSINTKKVIGNIKNISKLPKSLHYIFTSFGSGKGIRIITTITEKDIVQNNIDTELVNSWLSSK